MPFHNPFKPLSLYQSMDVHYMRLAIEEAKHSKFPYGCILVKDNKIIATGKSGNDFDPTAHAEINAIRLACKNLKTIDLEGTTLYATCEPCPMCFSAAWLAHIERIVYGTSLDESPFEEINISVDYLNKKSGNKIQITGGVLREEVLKLYKK